MIGRPELNCTKQDFAKKSNLDKNDLKNLITNATTSDGSETVEDGLEDIENEVTKLRWPNDRRLSDVRKLLQSAKPVIIGVQQRPEVSDHDFVEEQERSLQRSSSSHDFTIPDSTNFLYEIFLFLFFYKVFY